MCVLFEAITQLFFLFTIRHRSHDCCTTIIDTVTATTEQHNANKDTAEMNRDRHEII